MCVQCCKLLSGVLCAEFAFSFALVCMRKRKCKCVHFHASAVAHSKCLCSGRIGCSVCSSVTAKLLDSCLEAEGRYAGCSVVVHSGAFTQSQHCGVLEVDVDALGFDESVVSELRLSKSPRLAKL